MEDECKWYVLATRPRAEKKVSLGLTKIGVEHFLPLQKQLRQWKDRKKWVELPLFNSYIFVQVSDKYRNTVFEVNGVLKFLAIKGQPCVLEEYEVERIRKICAQEHEVRIINSTLLIGDEVEVTEGPLKGIKGKISEKANNAYLYILIENLGFTASFKIDKHIVRSVQRDSEMKKF